MRLKNTCISRWAVLVAAVLMSCAGLARAETAGPRTILPETAYDFGTVVEGTVVSHDFVIRNEGTGELVIEKVDAG